MFNSDLITKTKTFTVQTHLGQYRKHGKHRYIYHPTQIVKFLHNHNYNEENILATAWLHDVVEDCNISPNDLQLQFNIEVATLVYEVSHPKVNPSLNRYNRWNLYLQHYCNASTKGKILKLTDRICNLQEYLEYWNELTSSDKNFMDKVYLQESVELANSLHINKYLSGLVRTKINEIIDRLTRKIK